MHTTREYHGDSKRALRDARKWLGPKAWNTLAKGVIDGSIPDRQTMHIVCDFAGVRGYPVDCMWNHFNPETTNARA